MTPTLTDDELVVARFLARLTGRTRTNYADTLRRWRVWLGHHGTSLLCAVRQDVEEWAAGRRDAGIMPRTVCADLSHLHGFYLWAVQEGLADEDPTSLVRRPAYGRSECPWLGPRDLARLLEVSTTWQDGLMAAHTHLWSLSGLRAGEPRILRVEDMAVHDDRTTLAVSATKTPGRERVTLPGSTARILTAAAGRRSRGTLLIHPLTGRPWTKATESNRMDQLCRAAGVPRVTPRGLRVSFITLALAAGVPERDVAASARLTSTATIRYYDRLWAQAERAAGPALEAYLHAGTLEPRAPQQAGA